MAASPNAPPGNARQSRQPELHTSSSHGKVAQGEPAAPSQQQPPPIPGLTGSLYSTLVTSFEVRCFLVVVFLDTNGKYLLSCRCVIDPLAKVSTVATKHTAQRDEARKYFVKFLFLLKKKPSDIQALKV